MSSGNNITLNDIEGIVAVVNDTDSDECDNASNSWEGYNYCSDRSDILDESECSFGSDTDFESYVSASTSESDSNVEFSSLWSKIDPSDGSLTIENLFDSNLKNKLPEVKNCPPRNSSPDSYFGLFFTTDVWNLLTNETNKFANTPNRLENWVDITDGEMKKFFALLINMGLTRTQDFSYFWKEKSPMHMSFYSNTMSLERFKQIESKIHMSSQLSKEEVESDYNSWTRFRPLFNALNSAFMNFFVPAQDIVVEESVFGIVPKYKSVFVSYTSKHHVEFGLKKYDLCDSSTGYVLQSTVLSRTDFAENHINPFMQKAIFSLVSDADLLDKYHHLHILNTYPKLPTVKSLLERKVYVTANVNKKTKELPKPILQTKLNAGETVLFKSDKLKTLIVGCKRSKMSRYMVTTLFEDAEKIKERTTRKTDQTENSCFIPNPYSVAVDDFYEAIYDLTCSRSTSKYWRKILYNLIDVTVLNSYILYKLNTDKPLSKLKFLISIVHSLVGYSPPTDEESESDEFEDSESSDLSNFLMSDSDSKSDTESEKD